MIDARQVQDRSDLEQILELQRANLARNVSAEEIVTQGFVTVEHTLPVLERMHAFAPSIVAKDGDALAGYALVMPIECRSFVPLLEPMFQRLDALGLFRERFYVMGQICVGKRWRGQGVCLHSHALARAHGGAGAQRMQEPPGALRDLVDCGLERRDVR